MNRLFDYLFGKCKFCKTVTGNKANRAYLGYSCDECKRRFNKEMYQDLLAMEMQKEKEYAEKLSELILEKVNDQPTIHANIEQLAELEHDQWSHWMRYLFSKCFEQKKLGNNYIYNKTGNLIIPEELVKRWKRQMKTEHKDLSEKEKESDRVWAKKVIKLLFVKNIKPICFGKVEPVVCIAFEREDRGCDHCPLEARCKHEVEKQV